MPYTRSEWPNQRQRELPTERGRAFVAFDGDAEPITSSSGATVPGAFTYIEEPSEGALPRYEIDCAYDKGGMLRLTGVHVVRREGGRDVVSEDLARLRNLESVIEDAWVAAAWSPVFVIADTEEERDAAFIRALDERGAQKLREVRSLRKRSRSRVPDERFAEAARIYRENREGGKPTKAVADEMEVPPSTASWLVKQAELKGMDLGGPRASTGGASSNG